MDLRTVGILGTGEMGGSVGRALNENGLEAITSLRGRSRRTREIADSTGVADVGDVEELVRQSDVVLSLVPPSAAYDVARTVASGARRANERALLVELNPVGPTAVREMAAAGGADVDVVDGCVIGPARDLSRVTVYVSGERADDVRTLDAHGLNVEVLGDHIGQASGLKLCYAGMTKATAVVAMDLFLAAASLDVAGPLEAVYRETLGGLMDHLDFYVPGTPKRAERRAEEMDELAEMLESLDVDGGVFRATHERLSWLASLDLDTDDAGSARETGRRIYSTADGEESSR